MPSVKVQIMSFVDDYQPGLVECCLIDAYGKERRFVEKIPIVTALPLWVDSNYPQEGALGCEITSERFNADGLKVVTIKFEIISLDETQFDVFASQLEDV